MPANSPEALKEQLSRGSLAPLYLVFGEEALLALEAADSILAKAAQYAEVVYLIREQRLLAKEQIKQKIAAGALDEARQIATQAIAQIQKVITDVGSADVNL